MKIIENVEVPVFKPVHIVLESQGEVDLLVSMLGQVGIYTTDEIFGVQTDRMYNDLITKAKNTYSVKGSLGFTFDQATKREVSNV